MKILHVLAQLPSRTGSGVYFSNLIEGMKQFGHEQRGVFAVQDGFRFSVLDEKSQYPVKFKTKHLPFPIAGMSDVMPYENTVYSQMDEQMINTWQREFERMLKLAKADFDPDVVILHHLWMLTSMATEIFTRQVKIGICHNTDIRQAERHPEMKQKFVTGLDRLEAVFSLSDTQKDRICKVFDIKHGKIMTIGGGFNQKLFYPATQRTRGDKIEIVYSAKIERSKGVFELVNAFKKLCEINPHVHLDIIGTPNAENAQKLAALAGNCANISLTEITDQRVLADYLRGKDIFVMPSFYEGLGLMAIECLACGLRVVATEIEALMSLLGDEVNGSGVIEYVKLPRIYDTDKPYEEDLEQFEADLLEKLLRQVARIETGENFPDSAFAEIRRHSWTGIAGRVNDAMSQLSCPLCEPYSIYQAGE